MKNRNDDDFINDEIADDFDAILSDLAGDDADNYVFDADAEPEPILTDLQKEAAAHALKKQQAEMTLACFKDYGIKALGKSELDLLEEIYGPAWQLGEHILTGLQDRDIKRDEKLSQRLNSALENNEIQSKLKLLTRPPVLPVINKLEKQKTRLQFINAGLVILLLYTTVIGAFAVFSPTPTITTQAPADFLEPLETKQNQLTEVPPELLQESPRVKK